MHCMHKTSIHEQLNSDKHCWIFWGEATCKTCMICWGQAHLAWSAEDRHTLFNLLRTGTPCLICWGQAHLAWSAEDRHTLLDLLRTGTPSFNCWGQAHFAWSAEEKPHLPSTAENRHTLHDLLRRKLSLFDLLKTDLTLHDLLREDFTFLYLIHRMVIHFAWYVEERTHVASLTHAGWCRACFTWAVVERETVSPWSVEKTGITMVHLRQSTLTSLDLLWRDALNAVTSGAQTTTQRWHQQVGARCGSPRAIIHIHHLSHSVWVACQPAHQPSYPNLISIVWKAKSRAHRNKSTNSIPLTPWIDWPPYLLSKTACW